MKRGRFRGGAAILAMAGLWLGAGSSLAAIRGTYSGSGHGFAITFDVEGAHVHSLQVSCGRGAVTVAAVGAAPKLKSAAFTYSGPAASSNRHKTIHMKVTGTFTDKGRKVNGRAFTAGVCPTGNYTASK